MTRLDIMALVTTGIVLPLFGMLHRQFAIPGQPTRAEATGLGLMAGASFAIGEIWLVAYPISVKPHAALLELPWYAFGGFALERMATCFAHSLIVLPTLVLTRRGMRWAVVGLSVGMLLHSVNFTRSSPMGPAPSRR